MKNLKLIKGLSYSMKGFSAVKGEPFDVDDEKGELLLKTGRFKENIVIQPDYKEDDPEKPIDKMKKTELEELAAKHGIDISGCANNNERIDAIKAVLEKPADKEDDPEEVNFDEMSDEELAEYAAKEEVDATVCESREQIIEIIKAVIAGKDADYGAKAGFEE